MRPHIIVLSLVCLVWTLSSCQQSASDSTGSPSVEATPTQIPALNQACSQEPAATLQECLNNYCCQTLTTCEQDTTCQEAQTCFTSNGAMRSYQGIQQCIDLAGFSTWMNHWSCQFMYCGKNFMALDAGERCLIDRCPEETADCFGNPECFALKYCVIDGVGTPAQCAARHPAGQADYDRWTACGWQTQCFDLIGQP